VLGSRSAPVTSQPPEDDPPARASELVTSGQVYRWLSVSRGRGNTITSHHEFPKPWFVSDDGGLTRLWRRSLVVAWFVEHRPKRAAKLDEEQPGWRGDGTPAG